MKNRIIAAVAALSLGLASVSATEAQTVNNDNLMGLALGAVTAGALIAAIQKEKRDEEAASQGIAVGEPYGSGPIWADDDERWNDHRWNDSNRWNRKDRKKVIPAECVFRTKYRGHRRQAVSSRCLHEYGIDRRLPRSCRIETREREGRRGAYALSCLEDKGYRVRWWR